LSSATVQRKRGGHICERAHQNQKPESNRSGEFRDGGCPAGCYRSVHHDSRNCRSRHAGEERTDRAGGTYEAFAGRYKAILARSGVILRLVPSAGGVENLARLNDPHSGVMVALAQSGLTSREKSPDLESLGTLFYEPFWFFSRDAHLGARLEGLHGKKVSIGPEGSGTRALAAQFLAFDGIDQKNAQLLPLTAAQSKSVRIMCPCRGLSPPCFIRYASISAWCAPG
jgi:NMT1-like family